MPEINALKEIADLYREIDDAIDNFKEMTGLYCIHLCSRCCQVPSRNIESSILEVLPLVNYLMKTGNIEAVLEKLNDPAEDSICILYTESVPYGSQGRCTAYEYRPLVCRLFGHSLAINKYGNSEIIFCSELKKKHGGDSEKINSIVRACGSVPVLAKFAMRSSMIDPAIGRERFPLNTAIKKAIEFIGLRTCYGGNF